MLIYDIFLSSVAGDGVAVDASKRLDESIRNSTLRTECDQGAESLPSLREALLAGLRAGSLLNSRSVIQQPRARSAAVNSPMPAGNTAVDTAGNASDKLCSRATGC